MFEQVIIYRFFTWDCGVFSLHSSHTIEQVILPESDYDKLAEDIANLIKRTEFTPHVRWYKVGSKEFQEV